MSKKPTVLWFQAVTCNGNTHSFLSANSKMFEQFLKNFELIYHPSLTTETNLLELIENGIHIDYLLVEGAISNNTHYYSISENQTDKLLNSLVKLSKYLICIGSCASFGGVHKKFSEHSEIQSVSEYLDEKIKNSLNHKIINLTGCPIHPTWLLQTLFILKSRGYIELDDKGRPIDFYSTMAHHGCTRNEYFEWKVESKSFGEKEGCLFYEQGCRGPMTKSSCNKILWNDISSKTRVGMPCIGCTEFDFPRLNMFETKKNIGIPSDVPFGVSKRAYLGITGVAKSFKIDRLHQKLIDYEKH